VNNHRDRILIIAAGLVCMAVAGSVIAGELEPPVPPGTPTMKPLDLIETRRPITADNLPLTITEAGTSWYLVHDISTTGAGITVDANDVTIDLNGFILKGGTGVGIRHDASTLPWPKNISVRNGTVRGWEHQGIRLGPHSSVVQVRSMENYGSGIEVGTDSMVMESMSSGNIAHGIVAGSGSVVRDCVSNNNQQTGIYGEANTFVVRNAVSGNYRHGIRMDRTGVVLENNVQRNGYSTEADYAGIWAYAFWIRIEGNTVTENPIGIWVSGNENIVVRNTGQYNTIGSYVIDGSTTGNLIGTIRTSLTSAGPWDNLCIGNCP